MSVWYKKSDEANFCLLLLCTLLYHYTTILIIRLMADTPHELDRINCILLPDNVLASGRRTPWSPTDSDRRHPPARPWGWWIRAAGGE